MLTNTNTISGDGKKFDQSGVLKPFIETIRKYKPLSKEEENELFIKYKNGDKAAGDKIILHNQGFIFSMAKEYGLNEEETADYMIEGNIGIKIALEKFDPTYGVKFFTYASHYIRRSMSQYLLNYRDMVNQTNKATIYSKVGEIKQKFFIDNGRYPTHEELADMISDIIVKNVRKSDVYDVQIVSTDAMVDNDEDFKVEDTDEYINKTSSFNLCEETTENDYNKTIVMSLLRFIPKQSRKLIMKLYNLGEYKNYTRRQVMDEYYLDEIDLNKLEDKILNQLRSAAKTMNVKGIAV